MARALGPVNKSAPAVATAIIRSTHLDCFLKDYCSFQTIILKYALAYWDPVSHQVWQVNSLQNLWHPPEAINLISRKLLPQKSFAAQAYTRRNLRTDMKLPQIPINTPINKIKAFT